MGLKIWLAVASMLMVLHTVYGAQSTVTCDPAVVGGLLKCTCAPNPADPPHGADVTWTFDGATPAGTGTHKKILEKTKVTKTNENGKSVKCMYPPSTRSTGTTTVVEDALLPTIYCYPIPKLGVETTCTCQKGPGQKATPTECKLTIGSGPDITAAACNVLKYTPQAADNGKKITCKVTFAGPVDSPASTGVDIEFPQAKPTIEGASQTAKADVKLTCKAADPAEKGLKYKWYKDACEGTAEIPNKLGATLKIKHCCGSKQRGQVDTYICKVTNAAGDSPASDEVKVGFIADCPALTASSATDFRPSPMIMAFILLLTTILLKQ